MRRATTDDARAVKASAPIVLVLAVVLGACGAAAPGSQTTTGSPTAALATLATGTVATAVPSIDSATLGPEATEPQMSAQPPAPGAGPPAASIAVDGGDPVVGALGTFTWRNTGSDAPWLDGSPVHVGSGEQLGVTLARPIAVERWTAGRTRPGSLDGSGSIGLAEGAGSLPRFEAPPPGTWSVQVNVWFAANQGSAAYYWLVEVD